MEDDPDVIQQAEAEERVASSKGKGKGKTKSNKNKKPKGTQKQPKEGEAEVKYWQTNGTPPTLAPEALRMFHSMCDVSSEQSADYLQQMVGVLLQPTTQNHRSTSDCTLRGIIEQCKAAELLQMEYDFLHMIHLLKLAFHICDLRKNSG